MRHNAEPSEIAKALDAMTAIIGGASTVLQEGQEIDLLEATRRAGGDYATFTAAMDAMIADAVLGQRATSVIGPWQATAEIHAEVLQRLVAADARRLQATLRHSLAAWLTHWNHPGAATPRLARDTAPAEDLERRARRDAEIAAMSGLRPTQAYIERTYGGEWEDARQDAAEPVAPPTRRALADPGDGDAIATSKSALHDYGTALERPRGPRRRRRHRHGRRPPDRGRGLGAAHGAADPARAGGRADERRHRGVRPPDRRWCALGRHGDRAARRTPAPRQLLCRDLGRWRAGGGHGRGTCGGSSIACSSTTRAISPPSCWRPMAAAGSPPRPATSRPSSPATSTEGGIVAEPEILNVPDTEAIAHFRAKGFHIGFDWRDTSAGQHVASFTVAKVARLDILQDIRAAMDRVKAEGRTFDDFRNELEPILRRKGWWGRQRMADPLTGQTRIVQLGSLHRLHIIFDTNLRMATAHGQWQRIERLAGIIVRPEGAYH